MADRGRGRSGAGGKDGSESRFVKHGRHALATVQALATMCAQGKQPSTCMEQLPAEASQELIAAAKVCLCE